jgi:putative transposase
MHCMKVRKINPNKLYLITRRCSGRKKLLRPGKEVNQIVAFAVARAALKHGVLIHGYCVMSNHWHAIVTDVMGTLPKFVRDVHRNIAQCLNIRWIRDEYFWDNSEPSYVWLLDEEAVLEKLLYVMMNPVAAGAVAHQRSWPGLVTKPEQICGKSFTVKRPRYYYSKSGKMPEETTLTYTRPPIFEHLSDEEFTEMVQNLVIEREKEIHADMRKRGTWFEGRRKVLAAPHTESAKSKPKEKGINPEVASKNPELRKRALQMIRDFRNAYREAYEQWKKGIHSVVFPAGTYSMAQYHGATCVPFP